MRRGYFLCWWQADPFKRTLLSVWQLCFASTCNELQRKRRLVLNEAELRQTEAGSQAPSAHRAWLLASWQSALLQMSEAQAVSVRPPFQTPGTVTQLQLWALINWGWGTSRLFQSQLTTDALSWVAASKHTFTEGVKAAKSPPSRIRAPCFLLSVATKY